MSLHSLIDIERTIPNSPIAQSPKSKSQVNKKSPKKVDSSTLDKISRSLKDVFAIDQEKATTLATTIFTIQEKLTSDQAERFTISSIGKENFDPTILITQDAIQILKEKIAAGTESSVFESNLISTIRQQLNNQIFSPSRIYPVAIKKQNHPNFSYSPEKRRLEQAVGVDAEGIDHFLKTFKDKDGYSYSLHILYDTNLKEAEFHEKDNPVKSILTTLVNCSKGIKNIHDGHCVHRDIKGANILVASFDRSTLMPSESSSTEPSSSNDDEMIGVISDFGTLEKEANQTHSVKGTPGYFDPSIFHTKNTSIINQKIGRRIQTKEGDIFAYGITIALDVLANFIIQKSKQTPAESEVSNLINAIRGQEVQSKKFSDEERKKIEDESPFRTVYCKYQTGIESLYSYPKLHIMRSNLAKAISKLSLSTKESTTLIQLSELACDMQEIDLARRPTIETVLQKLQKLLHSLRLDSHKRDLGKIFDDTFENPAAKKYKFDPS